jgi:hypothetical protein
LLTSPDVVAGLRRAAGPFLLAGGSADEYWDGRLARSLTPHAVEAEGGPTGCSCLAGWPGRFAERLS